jgi:hypothetical protein
MSGDESAIHRKTAGTVLRAASINAVFLGANSGSSHLYLCSHSTGYDPEISQFSIGHPVLYRNKQNV